MKKIGFVTTTLTSLLFITTTANAQNLSSIPNPAANFTDPTKFVGQLLGGSSSANPGLIAIAIIFGGFTLLGMLIWGGFVMLSNPDNPQAQEAGQKRITYSIVGFLLLFSSFWIFQIIELIFGLNPTGVNNPDFGTSTSGSQSSTNNTSSTSSTNQYCLSSGVCVSPGGGADSCYCQDGGNSCGPTLNGQYCCANVTTESACSENTSDCLGANSQIGNMCLTVANACYCANGGTECSSGTGKFCCNNTVSNNTCDYELCTGDMCYKPNQNTCSCASGTNCSGAFPSGTTYCCDGAVSNNACPTPTDCDNYPNSTLGGICYNPSNNSCTCTGGSQNNWQTIGDTCSEGSVNCCNGTYSTVACENNSSLTCNSGFTKLDNVYVNNNDNSKCECVSGSYVCNSLGTICCNDYHYTGLTTQQLNSFYCDPN